MYGELRSILGMKCQRIVNEHFSLSLSLSHTHRRPRGCPRLREEITLTREWILTFNTYYLFTARVVGVTPHGLLLTRKPFASYRAILNHVKKRSVETAHSVSIHTLPLPLAVECMYAGNLRVTYATSVRSPK